MEPFLPILLLLNVPTYILVFSLTTMQKLEVIQDSTI